MKHSPPPSPESLSTAFRYFPYISVLKNFLRYLMGMLYIAAGGNHFIHPQTYLKIMPPWLPWPDFLVAFTGGLEILLGACIIPNATRKAGAWGLIILLILVFPANIQMMLNYIRTNNPLTWLTVLRLPIQALLIWWAWIYTRPENAKTTVVT